MDLFGIDKIELPLKEGKATLYPGYFSPSKADELMQLCLQKCHWEQAEVKVFGKKHLTPRLTAWMGDDGIKYGYSSVVHTHQNWVPELKELMETINVAFETQFNSLLLNAYRNGNDKMGWHADDEATLGHNPYVASINLGESRRFDFRLKQNHREKLSVELHHGDLLMMKEGVQEKYHHQVPVQKKKQKMRINLTFRAILK